MKPDWLSRWTEIGVETLAKLLAILLIAWVLRRILRLLTNRIVRHADSQTRTAQQHEASTRTLADLVYTTGASIVVAGAFLTALPLFGVNITPFAAVAGLASLAVGFGAQHLVHDLINGFFIVLEDQFVVGETIRTNNITGRVEHVTLRRTVLRDADGAIVAIPNGEIRVVANLSRDWSQLFVDIALGPDDAVEHSLNALETVCNDFRSDANWSATLVDGPRVLGVEALAAGGSTVRVQVRTLPTRQHDVARELRRRIRARFEREGIATGAVHRISISGLAPAEKE